MHPHEKSRAANSAPSQLGQKEREEMRFVKLGLAITIFVTALSVFLMSPERQTEVLETLGIGLKQRAFFALSIVQTEHASPLEGSTGMSLSRFSPRTLQI